MKKVGVWLTGILVVFAGTWITGLLEAAIPSASRVACKAHESLCTTPAGWERWVAPSDPKLPFLLADPTKSYVICFDAGDGDREVVLIDHSNRIPNQVEYQQIKLDSCAPYKVEEGSPNIGIFLDGEYGATRARGRWKTT